jgi:hypothetical protein
VKRRADRIRWGNTIALASGGTIKVTDVKRVQSSTLGEIIEITLEDGRTMRRTPGAKLDVVRSK